MSQNAPVKALGMAIAEIPIPAGGPYLFSGDLALGVAGAQELGYDGVELSLLDSRCIDRAGIKKALQRHGVRALAIATGLSYARDGLSLYSDDSALRQGAVARMKGHIDFAGELGCPVIIGGIRGKAGEAALRTGEAQREGAAAVAQCLLYAERAGVSMLLEPVNRYETNVINTAAEGRELICMLGASNIKLLLDTYHMNVEEVCLEQSIKEAGPLLGYVHLADSNRRAPGWGHIDFSSVLHAVGETNQAVDATIEVLPLPSGREAAIQSRRHLAGLHAFSGSET